MSNFLEVERFARRLRLLTVATATALVAATLFAVAMPGIAFVALETDGLPHFAASAIAVVAVALAAGGLAELSLMFQAVEHGQAFAPTSTRRFRRFALLILLSAIAKIVLPPLAQFGLAAYAGRGKISVAIDDSSLLTLLIGALLFFIARLFDEAARLEEDSRSIV